jgi:phosphatidylglycerol:prolipoprotein diacylglycerol transferase
LVPGNWFFVFSVNSVETSPLLLAAADYRYLLLMALAMVACSLLLRRSQQQLALAWWEKGAIGLGAFCGAMLGAKLPFVLADWQGLRSGAAWFSDGKTIMCGLVGAYLGVELAKWSLEIRTKTGDTFAAPVAVAVGIGRLACFVGGCCYGAATSLPWGVRFPATSPDNAPRHPTQLYEAAFHFALAGLLVVLQRRGVWRGQLAKFYILTYLGYRFLTEFIRPEPEMLLGLTGYQWAAAALAPVFAWLWWRDAPREAPHASAVADPLARR